MTRSLRSTRLPLALALVALVCVSLVGCSPTKPKLKPTPIPHADADDIVQVVATTLAADHGGWYLVIKRIADSLSVEAPLTSGPALTNQYQVSGGAGPVLYDLAVGYLRGDQTISATRDTSASDMFANVVGTGPFTNANGLLASSTYWLSAPDSAFFISNLQASAPDTIEFGGIFEDSCFALVQSTVNTAGQPRLWFHKNLVDFTLRIPKSNLVSAPYPVSSSSAIQWNIEAYALNASGIHKDFAYDHFVEIRMTFDGTNEARLVLGDALPDPSWSYSYRVNLNTGLMARLD